MDSFAGWDLALETDESTDMLLLPSKSCTMVAAILVCHESHPSSLNLSDPDLSPPG